ncbi:MAG: hypothetical protein QNL88_05925, partial [Acidobacteriota bacterium]|nr:hypothetical protein [Acidobacteriota bacterium]
FTRPVFRGVRVIFDLGIARVEVCHLPEISQGQPVVMSSAFICAICGFSELQAAVGKSKTPPKWGRLGENSKLKTQN